MRLSGMSSLEYPIRRRSLQSQYSSGASQLHGQQKQRNDSMKCLAFTNTMGKSNPGDKVDMDVSDRLGRLLTTHVRLCWVRCGNKIVFCYGGVSYAVRSH